MNQELTMHQPKLRLSDDGYVRLSSLELDAVKLKHLDSGVYADEPEADTTSNRVCKMNGYTEWISETEPAISIGWDWEFDGYDIPPRYKMVGHPFSNVVLLDRYERDLEPDTCMKYLSVLVGQLCWGDQISAHITNKYA